MPTMTTALATELELRRLRFFVRRLEYVRRYMSPGESSMLDVLLGKGATDVAEAMDAAIDRDPERYA